MNKTLQIFIGLFISFLILGLSITGGLYITDSVPEIELLTDNDDSNVSEVQIVNSTLDSSTVSEESVKSVVTIYSESDGEFQSQGSGFVYKDDYIMTNKHVLDGLDSHHIKYNNGEWTTAELIGDDEFTDLAILKPTDIPSESTSLEFKDDMPNKGSPVIALGSPNGLTGTVTTGIVSGINRNMNTATEFTIPDSIQTDAALNQGNSGGPLILHNSGEVVGVNTATEGENIGFAVSSRLSDIIGQSLIETGDHQHSYVGIQTIELSPITDIEDDIDIESGLLVEEIASQSANKDVLNTRNDTENPDVIVSVEGINVTTNEQLTSYIMRNTTPGDTLTLGVYRNGSVQDVTIELTSRP